MISLHEGANTRVRVDSELSEHCEVKVRMHLGSVLPTFPFAAMVDAVNELTREGVISELLYADDLTLMSERIRDLRTSLQNSQNVLKLNLKKPKVMIRGAFTKDGLSF